MSFFNMTQLGYDNQFQSMKRLQPIGSKQLENKPKNSFEKQRAREVLGDFQSREWSSPAISNLNYHSLRSMHVRGDQNPLQTARKPLTEAQEVGWWIKDQPLKKNEPWTYEKRHVHGQSEMTKFVDDMILTDRYFQLF